MIRSTVLAFTVSTLLAGPALAGDALQVRDLLERKTMTWANQAFDVTRMRDGYRLRGGAPLWVDGTELTQRGVELVNELARAYEDGLSPTDYLSRITGFSEIASSAEAAKLELAMTNAYLEMGRDLYSGLTTPSVSASDNIVIRKKNVDYGQWIDLAGRNGVADTFRRLRPNHPQYAQLRQLLQGYRTLMIKGGWRKVAEGPTIKPGVSDPRVVQIRKNLRARGYDGVEQSATPAIYDADLVDAVKHFQARHGLAVDGYAGPSTIAAMNVSAADRVAQLTVNLERWRWLPRNLGRRHVMVNQAGFELFLKDGDRTVDNRRVIVGKPYHQTPMFSDEMIYAEFNPTWTIPASILGNEMLPKIRRNPQYLNDKGYTLYTSWKSSAKPVSPFAVDWSRVSKSRFPYRVVQGPGPSNALGRVKFIFPNKFAVYMHDTPSRQLFSRTGRAFSHGCIRVHKPLDFAAKVFELAGGMNTAKIDSVVASKRTTRVNLKSKLPVHLAYFTAWVNENGVPQFFDDVYKRDRMVAKYMF